MTVEDQAVTESMGGIIDRSQEHLGSADVVVIRVRRRLLRAIKALRESGVTPPGLEELAATASAQVGSCCPPTPIGWPRPPSR